MLTGAAAFAAVPAFSAMQAQASSGHDQHAGSGAGTGGGGTPPSGACTTAGGGSSGTGQTAATNHAGHAGFAGGSVPPEWAGIDPTAILRDFDRGKTSTLPDGRTLRESDIVAGG